MDEECIVLLDNGSLRADAVLSLRRVAMELGKLLGTRVEPVSLLHSSKIPVEELEGMEAQTWRRFLRYRIESGVRRVRVVPLFFGPSSAIVDYLPKVTAELLGDSDSVQVEVAKSLVDPGEPEDDEVARMLVDLAQGKLDTDGASKVPGLIVVDHGSPLRIVAECRNRVAEQVGRLLAGRVSGVMAASMERRDGADYDFNEPLLERALECALELGWDRLVLSYLFFSPGRHAGPGGDIDQIVANSAFVRGGGVVESADLVGASPRLPALLARRFREAFEK